MARSTTVAAWVLAWYAGVTVICINIAATTILDQGHHFVNMFANDLSLLSVSINFTDASWSEHFWTGYNPSFTWDVYLNALCSGAQIEDPDSVDFRSCSKDTGKTFDLHARLKSVETMWYTRQATAAAIQNSLNSQLYSTYTGPPSFSSFSVLMPRQAAPTASSASEPLAAVTDSATSTSLSGTANSVLNATPTSTPTASTAFSSSSPTWKTWDVVPTAIPSAASTHVTLSPINRIVPFIFYLMGILTSVILWISIPGTFHGIRRRNTLNMCISGSSFLALFFASAYSTGIARAAVSQLNSTASKPYVLEAQLSVQFLALTWSATGAMFLGTLCLAAEWNMERFTPVGEPINRHWKPREMNWFRKTGGQLQLSRERPVQLQRTRLTLMDIERARMRQAELNRSSEMGNLSNVDRWRNHIERDTDSNDGVSVGRPD